MENKESQPLYTPEKPKERLPLTDQQKDAVRGITMGIEEVDETVRAMTIPDVLHTLENGHPLNRIITAEEGEAIVGFIACEDFVPHEAYIKYFGTTGHSGRNLLREIPAFIQYAKEHGYTKLNFHGWNNRLNRILERYGFKRQSTDTMGEFSIDFYEKVLTEEKSSEDVEEQRRKAFEEKYLSRLNQDYQKTLATFREDNRQEKEQSIETYFREISYRIAVDLGSPTPIQETILKLKIARYLQTKETIDVSTMVDAIIETPKFIGTDKGSFYRLLEVHEEKTLQKIAEIRKQRADMTGGEAFNPYEALFTTQSGKYYLARLLNMPHLEQESIYMDHCVGTSDSYINQMKRGDIEILSFRNVPMVNAPTQKLVGDAPIITIEYNMRTKTIEQIKKAHDEYLSPQDSYYADVIDALKQLRITTTDTGALRDFKKIAPSELKNIPVKDYHVLTERGEMHFRDFDPDTGVFVLKVGDMEIGPTDSKEDTAKIIRIVEGITCEPGEIAQKPEEVNESTKIYIGGLKPGIFDTLAHVEHIYTGFPEGKVVRQSFEIGGKSAQQLRDELKGKKDNKEIQISEYAWDILESKDFTTLPNQEKIETIRLKVGDLGFPNGATTGEIYAKARVLGLDLCPAEVGPAVRLQYMDQPMGEYFWIAMEPITYRDRGPYVFSVVRRVGGAWLAGGWALPDARWDAGAEFMFRTRLPAQAGKLES